MIPIESPRSRSLAYVLLTFAISWSAWGALALHAVPSSLEVVLFVVGGLGPFLAALVLTAAGGESVRAWLRTILRVRLAGRLYLIALLLPAGLLLLGAGIHWGAFGGASTPALLPPLAAFPMLFVYILLLGGGLEEPGWRGYLQPLFERTASTPVAAVGIGVIWAAWHLPLFYIPGTIQHGMSFPLYVPNVVGLSILLAYLTSAARGSVVLAIIFHAAANSMANYYPIGGARGAVGPTGYAILTVLLLVTAAATVLLARRDRRSPIRSGTGRTA